MLLILAVGLAAYANTFQVPFTLDDELSIIDNPDIRSLESFHASPTRFVGYLTFALNYHFGGLDVTGYHAVNLLIHLAAAVLVYSLLRLTFRTPYFQVPGHGSRVQGSGSQPSTFNLQASTFVPLFAALFFVAHPVQTQAVTYIVQRVTSLATMFYLLSVVLYVQARLRLESRSPGRESREAKDLGPGTRDLGLQRLAPLLLLAGSVLSAILAMKTKEIAFTLPLAIALYEVFFFRGEWKRRLLYLTPLLATLPIVPMSVFFTGESAGDVLSDIGEKSRAFTSMSRLDYLFTQFRVIVAYLRLLVLPANQNLDYDYPLYTTFLAAPVFLSFLLLAALLALAVYLFFASRRPSTLNPQLSSGAANGAPTQPPSGARSAPLHHLSRSANPALRLISFGILWFFLTLSVESSLIPIPDLIFEHRLYLPSFGAAAAFAAAFSLAAERFFAKSASRWLVAAAVLSVAALAVATFQRNQVWGSELRLWQDAAAKSPLKGRPLNNFGVALEEAGRRGEAIKAFTRAIEVDPNYYKSYYNLADIYLVSDQPDKSLPLLQTAIRLKPDFTEAYVKMGAALLRGGKFREVVVFLQQNLDRVGNNAEARFYLGAAYAFLGHRDAALRELEVVARLDPNFAAQLAGLLGRRSPHGFSNGRD